MKEVNYNETVILPFLQKKCQDLLISNLVYEANVNVLSAKINDLNSEIAELTKKVENFSKKKKKEEPNLDGQTY